MLKKPHDRQWILENVVIGSRENGEFITESKYMDLIHTHENKRVIHYALKLDNTIIFWFPDKFFGRTDDGKKITVREYDRLRRKARYFCLFHIKVRVGNECLYIDNFMLLS